MAAALMVVGAVPRGWSQGAGSVYGAYRVRIEPGFQTVGIALTNDPVAVGVVMGGDAGREALALATGGDGVAGVMEARREYYLEVTAGPEGGGRSRVGERYEIDELATVDAGGMVVELDLLSRATTAFSVSGLEGYTAEVLPHVELAEVFPPERFHADFSFARADQVQVFNGVSFDTYYLLGADGNFAEWRKIGAVGDGSKNTLPLFPGEGVFFKRSDPGAGGGPIDLVFSGRVRQHPFVQPLSAGLNFVTGGHPANASFEDHDAVPGTYTGSFAFGDADQISVHTGNGGFTKYYLIDDGAGFVRWVRFGGNFQSENGSPVFDFRQATFITRSRPDRSNRLRAPWTN